MSVLDLARKSLATDSRDKVYGLMGLMPQGVAAMIQPDYEQELFEFYIAFAKTWITATSSLELLEQCTSPNPDLPSWVPDWTNANHYRLFSGRPTYHATSDMPPVFRFGPGPAELSVNGTKVGEIDGLGASYYETYPATTSEDAMAQPGGSINAYGSDGGLGRAVWQTLTGNRTPHGRVAPETYQSLLQCPLMLDREEQPSGVWRGRKAFGHLLRQNRGLRIAGKPLGSFFPSTGSSDPEASRDALERIFRFHRSRRLTITTQGHLGLAPIASRKGDLVYLLLGCNVPMVLRLVERSRYQVIGACYLQGFMEGEAEQDLNSGNLHLEEIVLC